MAKPGLWRRDAHAAAGAAEAARYVGEVGRLVRLGRAKRGISRRRLAADSGISERYLAQIEGGTGNPSVTVLRAIALAIDVPVCELLPRAPARPGTPTQALDVVARAPLAELPALTALIGTRLQRPEAAGRERRIALIGLRGGGKSTLGRLLAEHFGFPFIEINRLVEEEYGAGLPLLIEMSGIATFRRFERICLERALAQHETAVIATAGGIVASPETYDLLLRRTHTIWVQARPEEHMRRVLAQGDLRPMAQNREAMADLLAILDARHDDYARAAAVLDTSGEAMTRSFRKLLRIATAMIEPAPPPARAAARRRDTKGG
ncbi:MAG: helix-turn-helix transcriptional regulator [Proteobacteria bacterium]|nr:helix-turn-helix transcriptional regulator [Pseudomonadota bacterium]